MINNKKITAIITAGGSGIRFNSKKRKQYFKLAGKTILDWSVLLFSNHILIDNIVLVVPESDLPSVKKQYSDYKKLIICQGGKSRQESVYNGLISCPKDTCIVLIHDGVRPFVYKNEISELIRLTDQFGAVIPVTKVKYTIKEITEDNIEKTIDRSKLVEVHTPQTFNYSDILEMHKKAQNIDFEFTDDASIAEYFKREVKACFCSNYNIKITNPEDLTIAKIIIKNFVKEGNYEA
jgi:2-C-methyl-D-erythritol 4-phosphate cytidylyltransferase